MGARADPHTAATPAGLLLVRGGVWEGEEAGPEGLGTEHSPCMTLFPRVLRSAPMPYLIGVHASLTEVSGSDQGLQGQVEFSSLCIPRSPPLSGILRL